MDTRTWRALAAELVDLVLPALCAGCGARGRAWCADCGRGIGPPRLVSVAGLPPVVAAGPYAGPLRSALLAYKERARGELVGVLAGVLAAAALSGAMSRALGDRNPVARPWWLVPAPSRASAVRARGGDHMLNLARLVAQRCADSGGSVGVSPAVRMRRGGQDSVGLDAAARRANLRGRLVVAPGGLPPPGAVVLVVDDVVTTGATLRGCVESLRGAGVPVHGALVLCDATTPRIREGIDRHR